MSASETGSERPDRILVIYVTAKLPYGASEPFLIPEVTALEREGCDVTVVPVRRAGDLVHDDAAALVPRAVALPVVTGAILRAALAELVRAPVAVLRALFLLRASRSTRILLKNLAVFPKGLWLGRYARRRGAAHLHAHWASTSATLAMVASEISGIAWSVTAHRWDIAENNLLPLKASRACFVRAISARGAEQLRQIVAKPGWSPWVLHVGVEVPPRTRAPALANGPLRILTAASFVEVKGHVHLLAAVRRLKDMGVSVRLDLAGDGPTTASLRSRVGELGLDEDVAFLGRVSHARLLTDLADGRWHAVVLPSVVAGDGSQEGIPVSLMEAMARGVPAVGTESGAIAELLGDGAGILVPPADSDALARALARLASEPALAARLAERGRARIEESFAVDRAARALHARFGQCAGVRRRLGGGGRESAEMTNRRTAGGGVSP
ncbi:MAG: glycosyltransferase family 4 protein [Actinomycetota bacterium]|nr:glycosyltransferase family 4 protein [Actinomycetota bacterium]